MPLKLVPEKDKHRVPAALNEVPDGLYPAVFNKSLDSGENQVGIAAIADDVAIFCATGTSRAGWAWGGTIGADPAHPSAIYDVSGNIYGYITVFSEDRLAIVDN